MSAALISLLSRTGLEISAIRQDPSKENEVEREVVKHIPNVIAAEWSREGERIATWIKDSPVVHIYQADALDAAPIPLSTSSKQPVKDVYWSNTGARIILFSAHNGQVPNIDVYDVKSKVLILSLIGRLLQEGASPVHFGPNDAFLSRVVNDGVVVYDLRNLTLDQAVAGTPLITKETMKHVQPSILCALPAPERADGKYLLAYFAKNQKGSPLSVKILGLNLIGKEIKQVAMKSLFQAQEVELTWNATGEYLLAKTHIDVDSSGKSYYGKSALYLVPAEQSAPVSTIVNLEEGPVQAYTWSTQNPYHFILAYGQMPCNIKLYDAKTGNPLLSFGAARRNFIKASHKLCCVAGFGNLPGDVDIWDLAAGKVVGMSKTPWAVDCEFSPDGYLLMASTTTPRLRVDNGIRILRANGDLLYTLDIEELYRASWQPRKQQAQRALSPGRKFKVPSESVYRPKGAVTATLSPTRQLTATKVTGGGRVNAEPAPYVPPGAQAEKSKKKKNKKVGVDTKVVNPAPVAAFTIEEPDAPPTPPSPRPVEEKPVAQVNAQVDKRSQLGSASNDDLVNKKMRCLKLLSDIRRLQNSKRLTPEQTAKVGRLPDIEAELQIINELALARQFDLDGEIKVRKQRV